MNEPVGWREWRGTHFTPLRSTASYIVLQKEKDQPMKCSRCGGYLAIEPSIDFYHPEGRWRCVNCGARKARSHSPLKPAAKLSHAIPSTAAETVSIYRPEL